LNYLEKFGCAADRNTNVVRFPRKLVESVVEKMRRDYTLTDRNGIVSPMRYTEMYMSTVPKRLNTDFTANAGGFPAYVLDLDGKRRQADMQDVIDSIRLADSLENIDLIGLPCSAQEIPYDMRPIVMTAELLKNTAKPGGIEAWTKKDIKYITEMAKVFRKDMDDLKRRPFLIGYGEVRSPLCLDYNMCEIFMEYVKMGLPQSFDTMPSGGSTAPATSAGTLVLGIAETLLGLILGYSIDENAWVSIDMNPSLTDMRTMIFPYAGADRLPLLAASNQMMRDYYGRPGGCHGGTNPPYISEPEFAQLAPNVREYEPRQALWAGPDGLDVIRRIVARAENYLADGAGLMLEIGYQQSEAVLELFRTAGYLTDVAAVKDDLGHWRVIKGRKK
jgi:trimethylamine:corrinoid methyltransferase-like protein